MKRTFTATFLGILLLSLAGAGCDKCPEAKESYTYELSETSKSTIPYAVSDSFQMADTTGQEATFAVMARNRVLQPAEKCECCPSETREHLEVNLNRNAMPNAIRLILVQDGADDLETDTRWTCWVDSSAFTMKLTGDSLVAVSPSTASVHGSLLLGSHTYLNVYEIHNGATDSAMVNVIWYNTHNGLLKYKKVNGQTWEVL